MPKAEVDKYLELSMQGGWEAMSNAIPELNALVNDDAIQTITVTRLLVEKAFRAHVELDITAPNLLPHAKSKLIEKGLATKDNSQVLEKDDGKELIMIGLFGSKIIAVLNISDS